MQVVLGVVIRAALAEEDHEHLAKHVERRQPRSGEAQPPQQLVSAGEGLPQNFVLGEKPSQRRNPGNC